MTKKEALEYAIKYELLFDNISVAPDYKGYTEAEEFITKIFDEFDAVFGEHFKYPYVQMFAGSNQECRFCGAYRDEKHKDNCLHLKFKELVK